MKSYLEFGNMMTTLVARDMNKRNLKDVPIEGTILLNHYKKSHLFEIDQTTKKLLVMTKTPDCKVSDKMPFPRMFIDIEFTKKELEELGIQVDRGIIGLMVINQYLTDDEKYKNIDEDISLTREEMQTKKHALMFYTFLSDESKQERTFAPNIFTIPITEIDEIKLPGPQKKEDRLLMLFFTNLIHLINDPRVKTVIVERDENQNKKREWKNKLPIPERNVIKLTGTLRDYINKLESDMSSFHYDFSFWVRGHFKHWKSLRYKNMFGQRTWVPPFVKGKGILVKKTYEVSAKEVNT